MFVESNVSVSKKKEKKRKKRKENQASNFTLTRGKGRQPFVTFGKQI